MDIARQIAENAERVRSGIQQAAHSAGRDAAQITMVAVTKYVGLAEVEALVAAGCRDLGESRPQELWAKAESIPTAPSGISLRWHLVGHLQRNKVNRTLPLAWMIHSVDSPRLLGSIEEYSARHSRTTCILLEVNISGEPAKHGLDPPQLGPLLETMPNYPHVHLLGLMAMASLRGGRDQARRDFERLRQWRDRLQPNCPPGASLTELSMGMTRDYDLAIAEGATIVRIGSALFEGVIP